MICLRNRPTIPGMYWFEIELKKPLAWVEATAINEDTVEGLANLGVIVGAFKGKDGSILYGTAFETGVRQGRYQLGEKGNVEFFYGSAYPFGYPSTNQVTKIGFYAIITKDNPIPAGAVGPMTSCFSDKGKFLYETDARGNRFSASARARQSSFEGSLQDIASGIDPWEADIPGQSSWDLDVEEEFGLGESFAQRPKVLIQDYRFGQIPIDVETGQDGQVQFAGAMAITALVVMGIMGLLGVAYYINQIHARYTHITFGKDPVNKNNESFLQKIVNQAKSTAAKLGWIIVGIVLLPTIVGSLLDIFSESAKRR